MDITVNFRLIGGHPDFPPLFTTEDLFRATQYLADNWHKADRLWTQVVVDGQNDYKLADEIERDAADFVDSRRNFGK